MDRKYLIVKGCAGLGNRLITLSNAIEYANQTNRILYVDWSDGQFGAKGTNVFYKYFQLNDIAHIQSIDEIHDFENKSYYPLILGQQPQASLYDLYVQDGGKYLTRIIPPSVKGNLAKTHGYWRLKTNRTLQTGTDIQAIKSLFRKNDIPFGGRYKANMKQDVLFFADFSPTFYKETLKSTLELSEGLTNEIYNLIDKYKLGENTIGVHVRMTDKQPDATLDTLKAKINSLNIGSPQIFLATDNQEVEEYFLQHFNHVVFTEKWRPENTGKQMGVHQYAIRNKDYEAAETMLKESIIDMWLLSKCEYLIAQKNSSFSRISSTFKNQVEKTYNW